MLDVATTIARARSRYAAPLYRTALLRDPDSARAARAVIVAFDRIDWKKLALDDHTEASLVAALPPLRRLRRTRPLAGVQADFFKLAPATRVALGLRLLRGMSTGDIAAALGQEVPQVRALLLSSIAALAGDRQTLDDECRRCAEARLDDPWAERGHVSGCTSCLTRLRQWEQAERELGEQLARTVGGLPLPAAVELRLQRLGSPDEPGVDDKRRQRQLLPGALLLLVVGVLGGLLLPFGPHRATTPTGTAGNGSKPLEIIAAAETAYNELPKTVGIVHRQWLATLSRPAMEVQADEWVDAQDPARHRLQLSQDNNILEWEVGDGAQALQYFNRTAWFTCGFPGPRNDQSSSQINRWHMTQTEQTTMRTARLNSGLWSLGLQYLTLARTAEQLRSLGLSGIGSDARIVLSAESQALGSTLLLSFDPTSHNLLEVREVRQRNGQTDARTRWKEVTDETLNGVPGQQALSPFFPTEPAPATRTRTDDPIDPACPLLSSDNARSFPALLDATSGTPIIGLPTLPAGIDQVVALATGVEGSAAMQLLYHGTGAQRLLFSFDRAYRFPFNGQPVVTGPWSVRFTDLRPLALVATIRPATTATPTPGSDSGGGFRVWSEGYTREELTALLAQARPLALSDWQAHPQFYWNAGSTGATTNGNGLIVPAAWTKQFRTFVRPRRTTLVLNQ